jgi:hypothetical protein
MSNKLTANTGVQIQQLSSDPGSGVAGQIYYNTSSNYMRIYNGSEWDSVLPASTSPKYRIVYIKGYVFGGYRNSSPWKNCNRTEHATDVTTNLGDIMDENGAYCTGGYSDTKAYMFATDTAFPGTTNRVKMLNMFTETSAGAAGNMTASRNDCAEFQDGDGIYGYVLGGGSANVDKYTWSTDTCSNIASKDGDDHQNSNQWGSATGGHGYQSKGSHKMNFTTNVWSTMGNAVGGQTHSKTLPSKHDRMYVENNGNSTEGHSGQVRKYDVTTDTHSGCNSFKPWYGGETNYEVGQDHGYGLGHCGVGCQSNHSFKTQYHTDSHTAGGTTMEIKGHDGASSGGCGSRN